MSSLVLTKDRFMPQSLDLDWSAGTVPVDKVNAALDAPFIAERPAQINTFERLAHDFYTPEKFANAPTGVQVVCRRFEEEKCMSVMKVVDGAIKAYKEKGGRGEGFREVAKKEWAAEYAK